MANNTSIIFDHDHKDVIPYFETLTLYNTRNISTLHGYFIKEIGRNMDIDDNDYYEYIRHNSYVDSFAYTLNVEGVYKILFDKKYSNDSRKKIQRSHFIIKAYNEETQKLVPSSIIDIRYIGIINLYKIITTNQRNTCMSLNSNILTYSGFKKGTQLTRDSSIAIMEKGRETVSYLAMLYADPEESIYPVYSIELEKKTHHPITNDGFIFKSTTFSK